MRKSPTAPTIDDFIASKLTKGEIAPRTAALYKPELERFEEFLSTRAAQPVLCGADTNDINHFLSQLRTSNSVNSTKRKLAPIREFFKFLQQISYRRDNPTDEIQLPTAPRRSEALVILSRAEMKRLLNAPRGDLGLRDKAILHLYYSGLKKGEGRLLSVHDVDLKQNQLKVSGRVVPLKAEAANALAAYLKVRPETRQPALFLTRAHGRMGERQPWAVVKKYVRQCKINDKANLETLRASYAVHAMEDGVPFVEILTALGTVDSPWLRQLAALARTHSKGVIRETTSMPAPGRPNELSLSALLHPKVLQSSLRHYEDGDYREAVLNGMLALTETIREAATLDGDGVALVSKAFKPDAPVLAFTEMRTISDRDEHAGFHKIMLGAFEGVRNPKSHHSTDDLTAQTAAQYLVFISLLIRRVEQAVKR